MNLFYCEKENLNYIFKKHLTLISLRINTINFHIMYIVFYIYIYIYIYAVFFTEKFLHKNYKMIIGIDNNKK